MLQYIKYLLVGVLPLLGTLTIEADECEWNEDGTVCYFNGMGFRIESEKDLTLSLFVWDICNYDDEDCRKVVIPAYLPSMNDAAVMYKVTTIEDDAFLIDPAGWHSLTCELAEVEIPETVVRIGYKAFSHTYLMKEIRFPDSVSEIGGECVSYSTSLEYIKLPEGLKVIPVVFAYACSVLRECVIPESVETIGELAFTHCRSLDKVYIPAGVKSIGNGAFAGMDSLESFEIDPDNENYCVKDGILFDKDMKTLVGWPGARTEVVVPEGVERIAGEAINRSDIMTSIDLPESLTDLRGSFLDDNKNLNKITVRSLTPPICNEAQEGVRPLFAKEVFAEAELWVPDESYEEYKAHPVWGKFAHIRTAAGVSAVADDDSAPTYYSLDGQKVDTPEPGSILIRRSGSTAEKIRY